MEVNILQKRLKHGVCGVLVLLLAVGISACRSGAPEQDRPRPEPQNRSDDQRSDRTADASSKDGEAQKQTAEGNEERSNSAGSEQWKQRLEKAESGNATSDKADFLVQRARQKFQNGEHQTAKEEVLKALELQPSHEEAQNLYRSILIQLGQLDRDYSAGQDVLQKWDAIKEQQEHKVQLRFNEGKKAFQDGDYDKAVTKFQEVLSRIRFMPVKSAQVEQIRKKTKTFLTEAREKKKNTQEVRERQKRRAMEKMARREAFELRQDRRERIKKMLESARKFFRDEKYDKAQKVLEEAEKIDPSIKEIKELKRIAWRMNHRKKDERIARRSKKEFRQVVRDIREAMIPQSKIVKYPDDEAWKKISSREPRGVRKREEERKECEQEILNTLKNTPVSFQFTEAKLPTVIDFFASRTGVNIAIDRRNITKPSAITVDLEVDPAIPAREALKIIFSVTNLDFVFRNCVMFVTKEDVKKKPVFEIYEIKDLSLRIKNFPGDKLNLGPNVDAEGGGAGGAGGAGGGGGGLGGGAGFGGGGGGGQQQGKAAFSADNLVKLIERVVEPQSWGKQGNSVRAQGGLLFVKNSSEVHDKVLRLLENIREATGIIVTVETRFLEVRTTLLDQLGVEFTNLQNAPPLPEFSAASSTASSPDFVTQNTVTGPGGNQTQVATSGIFKPNNNPDRAFSARTSHAFGQLTGRAFESLNNLNTLIDSQGANLQVSIINDISVSAVINAVKKDSRSREIKAPKLTLFNTQRGNVSIKRQISFVRDVDPSTTTGNVTADPEPGIVNDNAFILDVKPVVSADRRYVTLELRPTIADLIQPITAPSSQLVTLVGVGGVGSQNAVIELPQIEVKRVRTTVALPDGGTLLIGGLTSVTDVNRESKVPVLGRLPVVGVLGSKNQEIEDHFQLLILVRAHITIMEEVERRRFSTSVNLSQE